MINQYRKCPICEINYIGPNDKYCSICKKERKFLGNEEKTNTTILCPYCGENYIDESQEMCDACREEENAKSEEEGIDEIVSDDDDEYLDEIKDTFRGKIEDTHPEE